MNNEQMVSVPRELVERLIAATIVARGQGSPTQRDAEELLAQPAAQHQSEPVAVFHIDRTGYRVKVLDSATLPADGTKLYTRNVTMRGQGEPVAYIRQKDIDRLLSPHVAGTAANLEKEPRDGFVPFFTYTAPSLDERPSQIAMSLQVKLKSIEEERDTLHALLAKVVNSGALSCPQHHELEADICAMVDVVALSASAEPSAPKCKTCYDEGAVGNILNAEPCPDCSYSAPVEREELVREAYNEGFSNGVQSDESDNHHFRTDQEQGWLDSDSRAALERKS